MPRKAHLETHLSAAELKQRYQKCCELVESRRLHLLWLVSVSQNWQIKAAAAVVVRMRIDFKKSVQTSSD